MWHDPPANASTCIDDLLGLEGIGEDLYNLDEVHILFTSCHVCLCGSAP